MYQAACDADGRCAAWSFVAAGGPGGGPRCCLKEGVPAPETAALVTSGTKGGGSALKCGLRLFVCPADGGGGGSVEPAVEYVEVLLATAAPSAASTPPPSAAAVGTLTARVVGPAGKAGEGGRVAAGGAAGGPRRRQPAQSQVPGANRESRGGSGGGGGGELAIRVLVDSSVVEAFAEGGAAARTLVAHPSSAACTGVALVAAPVLPPALFDASAASCTFDSLKVRAQSAFKYIYLRVRVYSF